MKVLHVTPWYEVSAHLGGVPIAATNICRSLVEQGIEVDVVSTITQKEFLSLKIPLQQEVESYGVKVQYFLRKEWRGCPAFSIDLNRYLREKISKYDLIHIHATRHWHGRVVASVCSRENIPYVISPHAFMASWMINGFGSPRIKKIYYKLLDKTVFENCSAVHYTSEHERQESKEFLDKIPSFVVANGITMEKLEDRVELSTRYRKKLKIPEDTKVLLFVGRIHPVKNLHLIIDALSKLKNKKIMFFCVGFVHDRNYYKQLQEKLERYDLKHAVTFIPYVENSRLREWYLAADVFVLLSMGEGASMALSEALSCGTPVIISEGVSNAKEIMQAGCGQVIEASSKACLEVLEDFISNKSNYENYDDNARHFSEKFFEQKNVSKQMITVYDNIINNKN